MKEYNVFRTSKLLDGAFGQQNDISVPQGQSTIITTFDYPPLLACYIMESPHKGEFFSLISFCDDLPVIILYWGTGLTITFTSLVRIQPKRKGNQLATY